MHQKWAYAPSDEQHPPESEGRVPVCSFAIAERFRFTLANEHLIMAAVARGLAGILVPFGEDGKSIPRRRCGELPPYVSAGIGSSMIGIPVGLRRLPLHR
jgi:hypothetical protein